MTEEDLKLLMAAGCAGDARAQSALLSACAGRLRAYYGSRLTRQEADVEDLVQDTLIAIHTRRESYDPGLAFTAWLYGIGRYKLIDHYRRAGVRPTVSFDDVSEDAVASETDENDRAMASLDVERLLALLPPKQATAIRLTRLDGLAVSEAAALSGQSEASVKVGVHRGLLKLTALLQGRK